MAKIRIMRLAGKKCSLPGGNRGIGPPTARLFIAEGGEAAITGRDKKALNWRKRLGSPGRARAATAPTSR